MIPQPGWINNLNFSCIRIRAWRPTEARPFMQLSIAHVINVFAIHENLNVLNGSFCPYIILGLCIKISFGYS
ncbi:hypothetical protein D3C77_711020 [compost metagenome]